VALIQDEAVDEIVRGGALDALTWHTNTGAISREVTQAILRHLHGTMQPQDECFVWFSWGRAVALLGLEELVPVVKDASKRGFIDPSISRFEDFL
jgi:hypothetical protein